MNNTLFIIVAHFIHIVNFSYCVLIALICKDIYFINVIINIEIRILDNRDKFVVNIEI